MRSNGPTATAVTAVAIAPLICLIPGVGALIGVGFTDTAMICASPMLLIVLAAFVHRHWGHGSWQYQVLDLFESSAIQVALGMLIVASGRSESAFWLFYVAHVTIIGTKPGVPTFHALTVVITPLWVAAGLVWRHGSLGGVAVAAIALSVALMLMALAAGFRRRSTDASFERLLLEQRLAPLLIERERGRIARELHDGLTADLTAIAWRAAVFAKSPPQGEVGHEFDAIARRARAAIDDTKAMVWALRDDAVTWGVFGAHVRARCVELCAGRVALDCDVPTGEASMSGQLAVDIVRIVQESVRNALQHGDAKRVRVAIAVDQSIVIEIEDDGVGIPTRSEGDAGYRGGLRNLERRAQEHGGALTIDALDPGTRVRVRLPLAAATL